MPLSPLPLEVRMAKPGQRQRRQHRHALPRAQTWVGSWKLGQSHWVLVVTSGFYFGGISLVLATQLPVYVPFMQDTLPLVPTWMHSWISSTSARGFRWDTATSISSWCHWPFCNSALWNLIYKAKIWYIGSSESRGNHDSRNISALNPFPHSASVLIQKDRF